MRAIVTPVALRKDRVIPFSKQLPRKPLERSCRPLNLKARLPHPPVNEEGTEAAAATGVQLMLMSMPMEPPESKANHPFLLVIFDAKNQSLLFIGRLQKIPA